MPDDTLRKLERRWSESGDARDEAPFLRAQVRAGVLERDRLNLAAALGHPPALAAGGEPGPALPWELPDLMSLRGPVFARLTAWVAGLAPWGAEAPARAALAACRGLSPHCPVGERTWARELHEACERALADPSPMRCAALRPLTEEGRDQRAWNLGLSGLRRLDDPSAPPLDEEARGLFAREALLACGHAAARLFDPLEPTVFAAPADVPPYELFGCSRVGDPVVVNGEPAILVRAYGPGSPIVVTTAGGEREIQPEDLASFESPWARKRYGDQLRGGGLDAAQAAALSVAFAACVEGVEETRARIRAELLPWALGIAGDETAYAGTEARSEDEPVS